MFILQHLAYFFVILKNHLYIYDVAEMRKQRKMGHITIVGPSLGNVEKLLESMLNEERFDRQSAGSCSRVVSHDYSEVAGPIWLYGYTY